MKLTVNYLLGILMSFSFTACQFNGDFSFGVKGNGNVVKKDRTISDKFNTIEVGRGLDVYLTQSENVNLVVEADENLHDIIITEVEGNTLKIYAEDNISSSKAQKVFVSFTEIQEIESWGGSDVYSTRLIQTDNLKLKTTSGSDMELEVEVDVLDCKSTSGSDLRLSGTANKLYAEATSGSDIKAGDLITNICNASASSGADLAIHVKEKLYATATSGGDVKYYGDPDDITKKDGASGSIKKLNN